MAAWKGVPLGRQRWFSIRAVVDLAEEELHGAVLEDLLAEVQGARLADVVERRVDLARGVARHGVVLVAAALGAVVVDGAVRHARLAREASPHVAVEAVAVAAVDVGGQDAVGADGVVRHVGGVRGVLEAHALGAVALQAVLVLGPLGNVPLLAVDRALAGRAGGALGVAALAGAVVVVGHDAGVAEAAHPLAVGARGAVLADSVLAGGEDVALQARLRGIRAGGGALLVTAVVARGAHGVGAVGARGLDVL